MIRVVIVDDQTLLRDALRQLLDMTPDIRVVAEKGMNVIPSTRRARRRSGWRGRSCRPASS